MPEAAAQLAAYVRAAASALAAADAEALQQGRVAFPDPMAFAPSQPAAQV
jgi:hypothetical protein